MKERLYLGGFEIYREYGGDGSTVALERETLHVMDDKQRIALVERTQGDDGLPVQLIRYQFGNHLGSASLELDGEAQIISYEEYFPYRSTSYQAVRSQTETPKRYRYAGKERDEESGLYYNHSRYYASWLGCWTSCDPNGTAGGINLYRYANANPVVFSDPDGREPKRRGNFGDVNTHEDQGLRGKGTPGALESEHLDPIAVQRDNMRNPRTGRSPIPAKRGSAIDKAQPTVLLNKSTAKAKTALDTPVITGARNAGRTGQVPAAIANQYGPDAGLARARAAGPVPVGAEAAAIGQTDAKFADPASRAFARDPVNNPLLQVTDEEVCRAVDIPLNANAQTAGNFTSLAATDDSAAKTLFKGTYSEVPAALPHSSVKPSGELPPLPPVGGGGAGRALLVAGARTLGTVLAVKGAIDDVEEGDYFGAILNVLSIPSGPAAILSVAYHLQKAEVMAYGAILRAGVDSAQMYVLYIQDKVTPQEVIESHVDLSDWSLADRQEVMNRYMNGE